MADLTKACVYKNVLSHLLELRSKPFEGKQNKHHNCYGPWPIKFPANM
jgi:hypothetical protein